MKLAAGLQSQSTAAAISSAVPRRPIGWLRTASAMSSSSLASMSATMGVSIVPGQTALMRMPRGAQRVVVDVGERDAGALRSERARSGEPHPGARAGNEGDLTLELVRWVHDGITITLIASRSFIAR